MNEIWKSVIGYEDLYEISNLGRVRSLDRIRKNKLGLYRGKILKLYPNKKGYLRVMLIDKNSKQKFCRVHRLVLQAFKPELYNEKLETNHEDFNKANNYITNLIPITGEKNIEHYMNSKRYKNYLRLVKKNFK